MWHLEKRGLQFFLRDIKDEGKVVKNILPSKELNKIFVSNTFSFLIISSADIQYCFSNKNLFFII
jgi:hypothetical protein